MKSAALAFFLLPLGLLTSDQAARPPYFREVSIRVDRGPKWISVSDINHDGNPDILVANAEAGTVSVLLGDGVGDFQEAQGSPFAAGHLPNDIAIADMNGDGFRDLIIANHQSPNVTILVGNGKGSFTPGPGSPIDVHSKPHPHGVAVADFNGDGNPDVVTDSWGENKIELLLGDGKGELITPGRFFPVGHRPYERLRTADFNNDGLPDVVTTNLDDGNVTILLGDGKEGFQEAPGSPFPAGAKPWQVYVGDINDDGNADLVVIPYQRDITDASQNVVTVLLGDGHGAFRPMPGTPLSLEGCRGSDSVTGGFLMPGRHVIAVACAESRNLMLFLRDNSGRYNASRIPSKGGWGAVTFARLTNDPRGELITANNNDGTITIYFP